MGASSSQENQAIKKKQKKFYAPPSYRIKTRFDAIDRTNLISAYEAAIDKFDYLIVFPMVEGPYSDVVGPDDPYPISWEEMKEIWKHAVPGTDEDKEKSANEFASYFQMRTKVDPRNSEVQIGTKKWLSVAREKIVDMLYKQGLHMKLSVTPDKSYITCRVRAPIKLLEGQADLDDYKLQFRGEIDPGSLEFWNVEVKGVAVELEEDKKIYTIEEGTEILDKLFRAGKISANDVGITINELPAQFSRRIHVLERVADAVPITNKFLAYSNFTSAREKRFLFQEYPSIRGKTLFRYKDKLFLTKAILDNIIDFGVLQHQDVVVACMALHDSNRGDPLNIDVLRKRWVWFWTARARDVGSALVSDLTMDDDEEAWFFMRPFCQPLNNVREYFGEKVALYYAWLGHYTYYLVFPALLGSIMEVVFVIRGYQDSVDEIDWWIIFYLLFLVMWTAVYKQTWKRECFTVSLKWGTYDTEGVEKPRPQFYGNPDEPLVRSVITNENEMYFPPEIRSRLMLISYVVVFFSVLLNVAAIGVIFYVEYWIINFHTQYEFTGFNLAMAIIQASMIPITQFLYKNLAILLNDFENHRTNTDYEDNLINKSIVFDIVNSYGALVFTAFGKGVVFDTCDGSCMDDLQLLLYAIFSVRTAINVLQVIFPMIQITVLELLASFWGAVERIGKDQGEETIDNRDYIDEIYRETYEGPYDDYAEAVVQYGYVCAFSVAMPFLPIIALGENLLKIRMDAYRLCSLSRRPHVLLAEDIGSWETLMDLMGNIGCMISVGILVFCEESLDNYSLLVRAIIFLAFEQALLLIKFGIEGYIADAPQEVIEIRDRQVYVSKKYMEGIADDDNDLDISTMPVVLDDTIDLDTFNLKDLRGKVEVSADDLTKEKQLVEQLQAERRAYVKEFQNVTGSLSEALKEETFDEARGIGMSKDGFPLGKLDVTIHALKIPSAELEQYVDTSRLPAPSFKVRVTFRADDPSKQMGPQISAKNDTPLVSSIDSDKGDTTKKPPTPPMSTILFPRQALPTFAPIRTSKGVVMFEVMSVVGSTTFIILKGELPLSELNDQTLRYMRIPLKAAAAKPSAAAGGAGGGVAKASKAQLHVQLLFMYSKLIPMRGVVSKWRKRVGRVEKKLALIKSGKTGLKMLDYIKKEEKRIADMKAEWDKVNPGKPFKWVPYYSLPVKAGEVLVGDDDDDDDDSNDS